MLDMFQGDRVFASFNAVATTPAFTRRAITAAYDVRSDLLQGGGEMPALQVTAGISVGNATVGNAGTADMLKFTITGHVYSEAVALERYGRTTFKQGAKGAGSDFTPTDARLFAPDVGFTVTPIMIPGMAMQEVENNFVLQVVDVAELTEPVSTKADAACSQPRRRTLVASVERQSKTGDNNEWMYALENLKETNPYSATNAAFGAILRGETLEVIKRTAGVSGDTFSTSSPSTSPQSSSIQIATFRSALDVSGGQNDHYPPPMDIVSGGVGPSEDLASSRASPLACSLEISGHITPRRLVVAGECKRMGQHRLASILGRMKSDEDVLRYSKKF